MLKESSMLHCDIHDSEINPDARAVLYVSLEASMSVDVRTPMKNRNTDCVGRKHKT